MRLTRKKAIELCIELWTWLAETGSKDKWHWPKWKEYFTDYSEIEDACYCWFCLYNNRKQREKQGNSSCHVACPYYEIYGYCNWSYYGEWQISISRSTRKEYARLFLEQIKSLKP